MLEENALDKDHSHNSDNESVGNVSANANGNIHNKIYRKKPFNIKNFNIQNFEIKKYVNSLYVLFIFLVIFIIFTRTFYEGLKLFFGFVIFAFIPGLTLAEYLFDKLETFEKSLIAGFIGLWIIPLLMYYSSIFGLHSITILFTVTVSLLCIILLVIKNSYR